MEYRGILRERRIYNILCCNFIWSTKHYMYYIASVYMAVTTNIICHLRYCHSATQNVHLYLVFLFTGKWLSENIMQAIHFNKYILQLKGFIYCQLQLARYIKTCVKIHFINNISVFIFLYKKKKKVSHFIECSIEWMLC